MNVLSYYTVINRVVTALILLSCLILPSLAPRLAHADVVPSPGPCSQGFWKNRADGKQGVVKNNFTTTFDSVVTNAVALSNNFFPSNGALLNALKPPKPLTPDTQFAP